MTNFQLFPSFPELNELSSTGSQCRATDRFPSREARLPIATSREPCAKSAAHQAAERPDGSLFPISVVPGKYSTCPLSSYKEHVNRLTSRASSHLPISSCNRTSWSTTKPGRKLQLIMFLSASLFSSALRPISNENPCQLMASATFLAADFRDNFGQRPPYKAIDVLQMSPIDFSSHRSTLRFEAVRPQSIMPTMKGANPCSSLWLTPQSAFRWFYSHSYLMRRSRQSQPLTWMVRLWSG